METVDLTVLYATEGCVVSSSIALLADCALGSEPLYVISYDADSSREPLAGLPPGEQFRRACELYGGFWGPDGPEVRVTFCLLGSVAGGSSGTRSRVRPMFVCRFRTPEVLSELHAAIECGEPMSTTTVRRTLDADATFEIHDPLIQALSVVVGGGSARVGRTAADARYAPGESARTAAAAVPLGQRGLTTLFIHHEARVLAAFRRAYYGSSQSPFWFVAKFGPDEKSLVLAMRYYLLQAGRLGGAGATYDLQAIRDVCATYSVEPDAVDRSKSPASLMSFSALSKFCCSSGYARGRAAAGFPAYVERRIAADVREMSSLEKFITHDRSSLRVSDREFVTYVYLAHFECFNRQSVAEHLRAVTARDPDPSASTVGRSSLGHAAVEQFFSHVRAHFNIREYTKQNVAPAETALDGDLAAAYLAARTYAPTALAPDGKPCYVVDTASRMMTRLSDAEKILAPRGWPITAPAREGDGGCGIVRRLLHLAATERTGSTPPAMAALLGYPNATAPLPVYRVAMAPRGQAFAAVSSDAWDRITRDAALSPAEVSADMASAGGDTTLLGLLLTSRMHSKQPRTCPSAAMAAAEQMYVNRNEIFNGSLAVTNIILDLDVALREAVTTERLTRALIWFRRGAIQAMQLLFPESALDEDTHPCYFFKSACEPARASAPRSDDDLDFVETHPILDAGDDIESTLIGRADYIDAFAEDDVAYMDMLYNPNASPVTPGSRTTWHVPCTCHKKIGLRVCIPVPGPYVIFGSQTMRGVARVIQQAVLLDRDFMETIGSHVKNFTMVDTGVYAHGHSLRMPYFAKVSETGAVYGRLLPVFVPPPRCPDVSAFVAAHADPLRFHFHAPRDHRGPLRVIHSLGGDYISFFERKASHNAVAHFGKRDTLAEALARYGVEVDGCDSAVESLATDLLDRVRACLEAHFPEHAREYREIRVRTSAYKDNWALFNLVPARGALQQSLSCLRFKHGRGSRATARAFLALSVGQGNRLCVSFCQQCFATKCDNNRLRTIFTIDAEAR
ncbi:helicase-primase primase subunit [Bovine alphaherpesvirus 2]|uniref:Helicase-primase primase subunit n=1 Tax=Bovine alphaherpesvirus 2 TaxID=10295 RepID=A0A7T1P472_9ALPH|nr:helicase-primase primase subunit [Bovine alphaherpesvirus 2]